MRFRHGSRVGNPGLIGAIMSIVRWAHRRPMRLLDTDDVDTRYEPRQRTNAGFMDGHVST